jgi:hypothetical protein
LILTRAASVTAAPADDVQGGNCSANIRCGKLNISKPFGIVPAEAAEPNCGTFGFQVICKDDTPYLGYYRPNRNIPDYYQLQILDVFFYGNRSLLVADMEKLMDLRNLAHRDCQQYKFPSANTSPKIAIPLSISPINQNLILYNCTKPPPSAAAKGLAESRCRNRTLYARVGDELRDSSSYFVEGLLCHLRAGAWGIWQGERQQLRATHQRRVPPDMAAATATVATASR